MKRLCRISLAHDFYEGQPTAVRFEPDMDTVNLLRKSEMFMRRGDGEVALYVDPERRTAPDPGTVAPPMDLAFRLVWQDPALGALTADDHAGAIRLALSSADAGTEITVTAAQRVDLRKLAKAADAAGEGVDAGREPGPTRITPPREGLLLDGLVRDRLTLTLGADADDLDFRLRIPAIAHRWTYVVLGGAVTAAMRVVDGAGTLFDALPDRTLGNGRSAQVFRSPGVYPARARPPQRFRLERPGLAALPPIDPLPTPGTPPDLVPAPGTNDLEARIYVTLI